MNLGLDSGIKTLTEEEIYQKPQWFAVYTKPRSEKKLKDALEKLRIQTFLPLLKQKRKWSDRWKIIDLPLFPSYLFVKITFSSESLKILKEPNSVNIVHFSGKPAVVEEEDIELMQTFLRDYPDRIKLEEMERLKPGNTVKIKNGPFAGRTAIIDKIKNNVHIVLNLPTVGKTMKVELKKEDLDLSSEVW